MSLCRFCKSKIDFTVKNKQAKYCNDRCRDDWHLSLKREKTKKNPKKNPPIPGLTDIEIIRKNYVWVKYRITWQELNTLYNNQNGCCAICRKFLVVSAENSDGFEVANVDHCHATGKVRGLLCGDCNKGIGFLKDNTTILANAIKYLKES